MSGWQLSGDAQTSYTRFILKFMEGWTDDLILSAHCRDGDRVLDVACGTGIVANRVNSVSRRLCTITGIDLNEEHADSRTQQPSGSSGAREARLNCRSRMTNSTLCFASRVSNTFLIVSRPCVKWRVCWHLADASLSASGGRLNGKASRLPLWTRRRCLPGNRRGERHASLLLRLRIPVDELRKVSPKQAVSKTRAFGSNIRTLRYPFTSEDFVSGFQHGSDTRNRAIPGVCQTTVNELLSTMSSDASQALWMTLDWPRCKRTTS